MYKTQTEAHVAAVNLANDVANKLQPLLREAFRPWVGKKILKGDGCLTVACEKDLKLDELFKKMGDEGKPRLQIFRPSRGGHWLYFMVKTCLVAESMGGGVGVYFETSVSVGYTKGDTLERIESTDHKRRTDYTVEAVREARKRVSAAEKELNEARGALSPFSQYER